MAPASARPRRFNGQMNFFLSRCAAAPTRMPRPSRPQACQRYPTNETTWKSVKMCRKPYGRGRAHAGTGIQKRKRRSRRRARGSRFARARARSGQYYCSLSGRGQETSVCPGLGWAGRTALHCTARGTCTSASTPQGPACHPEAGRYLWAINKDRRSSECPPTRRLILIQLFENNNRLVLLC